MEGAVGSDSGLDTRATQSAGGIPEVHVSVARTSGMRSNFLGTRPPRCTEYNQDARDPYRYYWISPGALAGRRQNMLLRTYDPKRTDRKGNAIRRDRSIEYA